MTRAGCNPAPRLRWTYCQKAPKPWPSRKKSQGAAYATCRASKVHFIAVVVALRCAAGNAEQRHAAKACPDRPRRIDKAVGAAHRLPWVCSISWPVAELAARAWGALRSNSCDKSEHE